MSCIKEVQTLTATFILLVLRISLHFQFLFRKTVFPWCLRFNLLPLLFVCPALPLASPGINASRKHLLPPILCSGISFEISLPQVPRPAFWPQTPSHTPCTCQEQAGMEVAGAEGQQGHIYRTILGASAELGLLLNTPQSFLKRSPVLTQPQQHAGEPQIPPKASQTPLISPHPPPHTIPVPVPPQPAPSRAPPAAFRPRSACAAPPWPRRPSAGPGPSRQPRSRAPSPNRAPRPSPRAARARRTSGWRR